MSDGTLQTLDVTMLDDVNNASGLIQLDSNAIDKFAFAATSNSTDIGDLPFQLHESCGCSSTTNGYTMGGGRQGQGGAYGQGSDHIFKFSFTTDGNGTDIGNLSGQIGYLGRNGSQY